jgi:hypothetical protein
MKTRNIPCPLLSVLLLLAVLALAISGRAATLTVTTTADGGAGSLRAALASAADGDTIDATGVSGTIALTSGELLVSSNVTILGPGPATLGIGGNSLGSQHVFHISPGHNVTIAGLLIAIGYASGSFPANAGGGIYNDHSTLTVSNCIVNGNTATYGGGIYNNGESGGATLTLINSDVSGNNQVTEGGGIYNDGEYGNATLTVINSIVSGNTTKYPSGYGGGIYNDAYEGNATVTVMNSTLHDNQAAQYGAGIYNYCEYGTATLTVSNSTLSLNRTQYPYGYGGAIYNDGEYEGIAQLTVLNSTLSGNGVYKSGGAIYNYAYEGGATVTVSNSTLSGNTAGINGGGIYNDAEYQGIASLKVFNSTLSSNTGAIYNYAYQNNNPIYNGHATAEIGDTILNASGSAVNISNVAGTVTSGGYNLSSDDGSGLLAATGDLINTNPMLGPLQDNGGPTLTYALLPGSPAIDAGDPGFTPPPYFDQRGLGFQRVVNGRIDIGAFEVQTAGAPTLYISHNGNTVTVYWQNVSGWSLQQNSNLAATAGWTTSGYSITTANGTNSITITPPTGNLFFRLSNP